MGKRNAWGRAGTLHLPLTVFHRRFIALAAADDQVRVERAIGYARIFVAAITVFSIWLQPTEPAQYASITYLVSVCYFSTSIVAVLWLRRQTALARREAVFAHAADLTITTVLTLLTDGPNSPFFTFFIFALMAATYRWGMWETVFTTVISVVLVFVEAILVEGPPPLGAFGHVEGDFDVNRMVMRVCYLATIGIALGYVGASHQRKRESAVISWLGREAWQNAGHGLLKSVLGPVLQFFGSTQAVTILTGRGGRVAVWNSHLPPDSIDVNTTRTSEDARRATYLSDSSCEAWHAAVRAGNALDVVMIDAHGRRLRAARPTAAIKSFMTIFQCRSAISVPVMFRDTVIGRVFLIDPAIHLFERESAVRLGQRIASEIGPAAHNVFRLRRLRSRAESAERGRIARELHDGLLQSISAAELRIDIVRRKIASLAVDEAAELSRVQAALSAEVRSLRVLTRRMQIAFSAPSELQHTLTDLITRFERETGISVRFESEHDAYVPPRTRYEIARIVQEGLTNIRKHSGAQHVMVRLASTGGSVKLVIEDDGRGFSFSGDRSQRELEVMCAGPLIIRERVRALRGELNVVSMPGKGARLHVKVPATQ